MPVVQDRKSQVERIESMTRRFVESTQIGKPDECWINEKKHMMAHTGRLWAPHKISYFIYKGVPPENAQIRRTCKNKHCVNPLHLMTMTEVFQANNHVVEESRWKQHSERMAELIVEDLVEMEFIERPKRTAHRALVAEIMKVMDANGFVLMDSTTDEDKPGVVVEEEA